MTFELRLSVQAKVDAVEIRDFLNQYSASGAERWFQALQHALEGLKETADQRGLAPEADLLEVDLRQALFRTRRGNVYRAVFIIEERTVHILAIRSPGQDLLTRDDLNLTE